MRDGVTLTRESKDFVPADVKLRPYGDKIIVKPLDDNLSQSLITLRDGQPLRGKVLAAGKGAYRLRYNKDRSKVYQTDAFIPMSVKVGDVVYFGSLSAFDGRSFTFDELNWGNEKCLVITERDVNFIEQA